MLTYNRVLFMNGPWSGQEAFQQLPDGELFDLEGNVLDLAGASYAIQVVQADATPPWTNGAVPDIKVTRPAAAPEPEPEPEPYAEVHARSVAFQEAGEAEPEPEPEDEPEPEPAKARPAKAKTARKKSRKR